MKYICDRCGGESDLKEIKTDNVRMGAVVCGKCGAIYPSYYIDPAFKLKMRYMDRNSLNRERKRLLKVHKEDFDKRFKEV